MKRIIFILCLFPISAFSQEKDPLAKLYLKSGYIAEGTITFMSEDFIRFEEILSTGLSKTSVVHKSHIYLLTSSEGDTIFINPEKEKEHEARRKRLIEKNILRKSETIAENKRVVTQSSTPRIDQAAQQKEKIFNPDGEIGTAFIDLGTILPFGDDPISTGNGETVSFDSKTSNIFALIGVPISEEATLFGGFQRFSIDDYSYNAISLKVRFYINK